MFFADLGGSARCLGFISSLLKRLCVFLKLSCLEESLFEDFLSFLDIICRFSSELLKGVSGFLTV